MKFGRIRFSSAWIAITTVFVGAIIAGCSGGGNHTAIPASSGSSGSAVQTTGGSGAGSSGTLSISVTLPASHALASSTLRSPQYVSGGTNGVYITGTCLTGGGGVTQSCTGAAFPAVYADVSGTSPLCTGSPRTCTLSANPVPGFHYAITVAAVDAKPTAEAASGYGTGFSTAANMLAVGSQPNPLPAATGSPAPSPTPTNLGPFISSGATNSVNVFLNAIATQFVRINEASGFAAAAPNPTVLATPGEGRVIVEPANFQSSNLPLFFSAGDAANNLIAGPPTCAATYNSELGSGAGATIASTNFPSQTAPSTNCDGFAGPDGKQYALQLTSSLPTHLFNPGACPSATSPATPPPCPTPNPATGLASAYDAVDFSPIFEEGGIWTQTAAGVLNTQNFYWDGNPANDSCTAPFTATTKCGVPIPIAMTNNIPTTATPIVGRTTTYNVTNSVQFLLAPFVVTISCGTNPGCSTTNTPPNCTGICPTVYLNGGGTATVTAYLYASGGESNFAGNTGCYGSPTTTPCLVVAQSTTQNVSGCYSGMNYNTGLLFTGTNPGSIGCADSPDPATAATTPPTATNTTPTANAIDCEGQPTGSTFQPYPTYPVIAYVSPGTFSKGSITAGALQADSMTFTIKASAPNAGFTGTNGFCQFQITQNSNFGIGTSLYLPSGGIWLAFTGFGSGTPSFPTTLPSHYSPVISVGVSQNSATLPIPVSTPFP